MSHSHNAALKEQSISSLSVTIYQTPHKAKCVTSPISNVGRSEPVDSCHHEIIFLYSV